MDRSPSLIAFVESDPALVVSESDVAVPSCLEEPVIAADGFIFFNRFEKDDFLSSTLAFLEDGETMEGEASSSRFAAGFESDKEVSCDAIRG